MRGCRYLGGGVLSLLGRFFGCRGFLILLILQVGTNQEGAKEVGQSRCTGQLSAWLHQIWDERVVYLGSLQVFYDFHMVLRALHRVCCCLKGTGEGLWF